MNWRRFLERARWDREKRDEMDSYLAMEIDDNTARGMEPSQARAAALRKLGNRTMIREEIYQMNTIHWLDELARDLRYGFRALHHNPLFTAVALVTLAIGIGANTAVFSVVNSVLLKPLRYPDPDRVVAVAHSAPGAAGLSSVSGDLRLSASMYFTYAEQNRTFEALGVWGTTNITVTGLAEPEQVRGVYLSDGALQALGVAPEAGRWLSKGDQVPGGAGTVMLGYGYWQRRFGGDRKVIGRNITVDSRPREIVGVMPRGFKFVNSDADLIVPVAFDRSKLRLPGFGYECVGRLKSGITITQANADIARLVPIWMTSWPAAPDVDPHVYDGWRIRPAIRPLKQDIVGSVGSVLWIVMATIGVVMLIACANVANLLLVRGESRQQEFAVRAALGAGRGRIVRELLVESALLGIMGGALGLCVGYAGLQLLVAIGPGNLPRLSEISLDKTTLAFTLAVSLLSGLLFGLIPALKYAGPGRSTSLRGGGRTSSQSRERHRARNVLVVVQVALAMVLLVSAGLMIRTFQALRNVDPGIRHVGQIQLARIAIPSSLVPEPERVIRIENDMVERLRAIPGVKSVAFAADMPMEKGPMDWDAVRTESTANIGSDIPPMRVFCRVSPGIFETEGTRFVAGRDYTWTDIYGLRKVVIISENLARELWGAPRAAVGKRLAASLPSSPWYEIIGVVQDVRYNGVQESAPEIVYWPAYGVNIYGNPRKDIERAVTFAIRSERSGSEAFLNQVSEAIWSVNSNFPLASVRTMQDVYDKSMARSSFALVMLAIAGSMALLLGIVGIYGVISYAVSQRHREIGIRLALGAQQSELRRMFVAQGLLLAAMGVLIGVSVAAALMRLVKSLLFGISPQDPFTYFAVVLVLVAAAGFASYLPARKAARVDPIEALRAE